MNFFESFFLWKEAVISSVFLASALAMVGTYSILRRVVFLPAALSQFSGLGVMFAFVLLPFFPEALSKLDWIPLSIAFVFSLVGVFGLGKIQEAYGNSREAIIGMSYIIASAGVVALASVIPEESHQVNDMLFGNALLVDPTIMYVAIAASSCTFAIHIHFKNFFMFVSFDAETAAAHGISVGRINALLFVSIALMISVSTKTIGALPTFAFSTLPAYVSIQVFRRTNYILLFGAILAAACAFLGYWMSFALNLPTGATTTLFTGGISGLVFVSNKFRRQAHTSKKI